MENLDKYLHLTKLKQKVEKNAAKKDAILLEYKEKEKKKPLTQLERLARLEKLMGIEE